MQQLLSIWRTFVLDRRADADVTETPGVTARWADSAFPFWNTIFLTEQIASPTHLKERLRQAVGAMHGRTQSGLVCVCEEYLGSAALADLPEATGQAGLAFALTLRGMAGDLLPIPEPEHPALRFTRVMTDDGLRDYGDINARAYGFPAEAGPAALVGSSLWKRPMQTWLGYAEDRPVCAAATVANQGCLYLSLVATLPEAQRKGYGEAIVRKALYEGGRETGIRRTILHATDAGFPVYRRIGYHQTCTFRVYAARR